MGREREHNRRREKEGVNDRAQGRNGCQVHVPIPKNWTVKGDVRRPRETYGGTYVDITA